jgi:hypothetical protein
MTIRGFIRYLIESDESVIGRTLNKQIENIKTARKRCMQQHAACSRSSVLPIRLEEV